MVSSHIHPVPLGTLRPTEVSMVNIVSFPLLSSLV